MAIVKLNNLPKPKAGEFVYPSIVIERGATFGGTSYNNCAGYGAFIDNAGKVSKDGSKFLDGTANQTAFYGMFPHIEDPTQVKTNDSINVRFGSLIPKRLESENPTYTSDVYVYIADEGSIKKGYFSITKTDTKCIKLIGARWFPIGFQWSVSFTDLTAIEKQ